MSNVKMEYAPKQGGKGIIQFRWAKKSTFYKTFE